MEVNQEVSGMIDDLVRENLGSVLTVGREKKQLTVREVAEHLRLMPYQIEALEKEDFAIFKAEIFVKSYLRNYATLLDIDPQIVIALYEANHLVEQAPPVIRRPSPIHVPCKKRYIGVAAVLVIVVLLWLLNGKSSTEVNDVQQEPLMLNEQPHGDISGEGKKLSSAEDASELPDSYDDVEIQLVANAALDIVARPLLADVESPQGDLDVDAVIADVVSELPVHRLDMTFTAECWVEIKDAEGKVLLADLKRSGDEVHIEGEAPFKVLLGYAPAVQLSYNGELVKISTKNSRQSAKLVVGRS